MPNNNDVGIPVSRNFLEGLLEYLLRPINFVNNNFVYPAEGNKEIRDRLFKYLKLSPISAVVSTPTAQLTADPLSNSEPVAMSTALPIDNNFAKIITLRTGSHNGRQVLFYLDYDETKDVTILHQIVFYNGVKWDFDFEYEGPGNHLRARDEFNTLICEEYAERLLLSICNFQTARRHSPVIARTTIKMPSGASTQSTPSTQTDEAAA